MTDQTPLTDERAAQLAESRYNNGYGPNLAEPWDQLLPATREFLINEAANWLRAAVAAGLMPAAEIPMPRPLAAEAASHPTDEDLADANNPTPLRWGLNDVMWCDDDNVIVLLSGPDREPYWLELDPERAAVLREDLAGPDGATTDRGVTASKVIRDAADTVSMDRDYQVPADGPLKPGMDRAEKLLRRMADKLEKKGL